MFSEADGPRECTLINEYILYIVNGNGIKDEVFEWYSADKVGHDVTF